MSILWADLTPRERDALVAEKVMGYEMYDGLAAFPEYYLPGFDRAYIRDVPNFSTSISDAWQVVEKMRKDGFGVNILLGKSGMNVECEVYHFDSGHGMAYESGSTAEEAIVLAALKTCGIEVVT